MSNSLKNILIFTVGAAIGSLVTWKFVESKYAKYANDEIAEVKDYYHTKYGNPSLASEEPNTDIPVPTAEEQAAEVLKLARENGYMNYSDISSGSKELEEETNDGPYRITPEEFDTIDDYIIVSLTYHSDGVVVDEDGDRVGNVDDIIGADTLSDIGTYDEDGEVVDAVYARNDKLKADYEILYDHRTYASIVNRKPHHME